MAKEVINLNQIRKQNSKRLEQLLTNPKRIEKLAKEKYGKQWTKIWAGEHHPNNTQIKK